MSESQVRESALQGRRVLVVEDDYFWADELSAGLRRVGVAVLGPTGTITSALDLLAPEPDLDAAVIDMNLRGERADPVADRLLELGVPVLLVTGYETATLSPAYAALPCLEKPVGLGPVLAALGRLLPPV